MLNEWDKIHQVAKIYYREDLNNGTIQITDSVLSWCIVLCCTCHYLLYLNWQFWTVNWTELEFVVTKVPTNVTSQRD